MGVFSPYFEDFEHLGGGEWKYNNSFKKRFYCIKHILLTLTRLCWLHVVLVISIIASTTYMKEEMAHLSVCVYSTCRKYWVQITINLITLIALVNQCFCEESGFWFHKLNLITTGNINDTCISLSRDSRFAESQIILYYFGKKFPHTGPCNSFSSRIAFLWWPWVSQ